MHCLANSSKTRRYTAAAVAQYVFRWTGRCLFLALPLLAATVSQAAQVTLQWDAVPDANVAGYRVFSRIQNKGYDYATPAWQGADSVCTIAGLSDGTSYYFVVRAFDRSDNESGDSNEVSLTAAGEQSSVAADSLDAAETADETAAADSGDDTDEAQGANPFPPAEAVDTPCEPSGEEDVEGSVPETPETTLSAQDPEQVSCEPDLLTSDFASGSGSDRHAYTRWLIFRDSDDLCVFDQISEACLTAMSVPPLILEGGTGYYWTATHYARSGAASRPADDSYFTTVDGEEDLDANGIPDSQELGTETDLDHNGQADETQEDMKCFRDAYGTQAIGVKLTTGWPQDQLAVAQSVDPMAIATPSGTQPDLPGGLINFKLQLESTSTSAVVSIYFPDPVPDAVYWLIFDPARGYLDFGGNTSVSSDRRTVTLYLEDGEPGDMDGVANGVIVAMAGYGYAKTSTGLSSLSGSAGIRSDDDWPWDYGVSCFIDSLLIK